MGKLSRRNFLKTTGLGILGFLARRNLVSPEVPEEPEPEPRPVPADRWPFDTPMLSGASTMTCLAYVDPVLPLEIC